MKYTTDSTNDKNKIRFQTLSYGDVFRLGSSLYIKTEELELRDEYYDDPKYFNAVDLRYGEHRYFESFDTVERYEGEIVFKEDDFHSDWN